MKDFSNWFGNAFKYIPGEEDKDQNAISFRLTAGYSSKWTVNPFLSRKKIIIKGANRNKKLFLSNEPVRQINAADLAIMSKSNGFTYFYLSEARYFRYQKDYFQISPGASIFFLLTTLGSLRFVPKGIIILTKIVLLIGRNRQRILCSTESFIVEHLRKIFTCDSPSLPIAKVFVQSELPTFFFNYTDLFDFIKTRVSAIIVVTQWTKSQKYYPTKVTVVSNAYKQNAYLFKSNMPFPPTCSVSTKSNGSQVISQHSKQNFSFTVKKDHASIIQLTQKEAAKYFTLIKCLNIALRKRYGVTLEKYIVDFIQVKGKILIEYVHDFSFSQHVFQNRKTLNGSVIKVLIERKLLYSLEGGRFLVEKNIRCNRPGCFRVITLSENTIKKEVLYLFKTVRKFPNMLKTSIREVLNQSLTPYEKDSIDEEVRVCNRCSSRLNQFHTSFIREERRSTLLKSRNNSETTSACIKLYDNFKRKLIMDKIEHLRDLGTSNVTAVKDVEWIRDRRFPNPTTKQVRQITKLPLLTNLETRRYQVLTSLLADTSHSSTSSTFSTSSADTEMDSNSRLIPLLGSNVAYKIETENLEDIHNTLQKLY